MTLADGRAANVTHHPPLCKGFQNVLRRHCELNLWFLGQRNSNFLRRGGATELLVKLCGSEEFTVVVKLAECRSPRSPSLWI